MPTHQFDNGADYFCNGLTRYVLDAKLGYMNRELEVVVAPAYDFGFPFRGGLAVVCDDCRFPRNDEHTGVDCRRCGAVDTRGMLVHPLQATPFENAGANQAADSDCQ